MSAFRGNGYETSSIVYYVCYIISWKTGNIITFVHFEERNLAENEHNTEEKKPFLASIDGLSTDNESYDGSISIQYLEDIRDRSQIYPDIKGKYSGLKICDRIRQTQHEWKGAELSAKIIGKGLHKVFKAVVNEINDECTNLG